jgi:D-alanine-D-alanine ligase
MKSTAPARPTPAPPRMAADSDDAPGRGLLRPKNQLSAAATCVLAIVALLPLIVIALRILALPGVVGPEWDAWRAPGIVLDRVLSLSDVPADQRDHVIYLLFVPTCALLVALARLTFGLRVLGFRSILIAVAFHQSGVVASLLLIAVAVITVLLLRPWLRRIQMPYYARVSMILCTVSVTMVGAVVIGPWMRQDIVWGIAYFPVIVLGMLAEGIARTVDRDNAAQASWLALNTVGLAFLMALVCQVPALRGFILRFPEIVLTQVVMIVMISEFLDLRLLQRKDPALEPRARPRSDPRSLAVAVVRNRIEPGHRGHALRSVQKIVDALRAGGYRVRVLEGNAMLLRRLRKFFPADRETGERRGMVLNLAHGVKGDDPTTHVPAVLEMSGVPYTGPTPAGHATLFDRVLARMMLKQAGIPTPAFRSIVNDQGDLRGLQFPAVVRARHDPGPKPAVVSDRRQLRTAVKRVVRRTRREAFVEELVTGRLIQVGLIGNDPIECLPLVEVDPERRLRICPAPLDDTVAQQIREHAQAAFRTCGCRDYARVDIRLGESQDLWVLEVRNLGILAGGGSFVQAGAQAGYTFQDLVCRIVEVARIRAREARPAVRDEAHSRYEAPVAEEVAGAPDAFEVAAAPGSR